MSIRLNGDTRLFPIVGDPITYVESPWRLTSTLEQRGHNGLCFPLQVPQGYLDVVMVALTAAPNVDGVLVTMPHKPAAFGHCATSSERAQLLGVVSVLRRNGDGTWHGDMLDGLAFVKAQRNQGAQLEGSRALLVGAGGAGSAIALALLEAGVGELIVHDADESRVAALVSLLTNENRERVRSGTADPAGCDLVFNATPMGMEAADPLPIDIRSLTSTMFVGDVIAGHLSTSLIEAARAAGCATADGGHMVEAVQDLMADFLLDGARPPHTRSTEG
jgi:shikimate dehydrogenase